MRKRKICFVVTSHIHYTRNKLVLDALRDHPRVELQIVVGGSAILPKYGEVLDLMQKDGFKCSAKITMVFEGGSPIAMAKTTGIGITEFATVFDNLNPDVVIVRGDRYEVLSAAIAASYLNIPVAHIEGGDVTGTIDESVRHAITKLAHIHFATNEVSLGRILRMGERPEYVFNVGSPELEFTASIRGRLSSKLINYLGVGDAIDIRKPYLVVMQHPVTSEIEENQRHIMETLHAIHGLKMPTIWFWPNVDAGTDDISKVIRTFREEKSPKKIRFIKYLPPDEFTRLLKSAKCLVGNSSSGIKECSYLGVPVVNIGTRQNGRLRTENVIDVPYDRNTIHNAVRRQIANGEYPRSHAYYQKGTGQRIADTVATVPLYTQKQFVD